jgi:hypothetical protein
VSFVFIKPFSDPNGLAEQEMVPKRLSPSLGSTEKGRAGLKKHRGVNRFGIT